MKLNYLIVSEKRPTEFRKNNPHKIELLENNNFIKMYESVDYATPPEIILKY